MTPSRRWELKGISEKQHILTDLLTEPRLAGYSCISDAIEAFEVFSKDFAGIPTMFPMSNPQSVKVLNSCYFSWFDLSEEGYLVKNRITFKEEGQVLLYQYDLGRNESWAESPSLEDFLTTVRCLDIECPALMAYHQYRKESP